MWKSGNQHHNKGFTLTELLVTIGIIAILGGIGTIAVFKMRGTSHQVACINNLRAISAGLQMHYNDMGTFPQDGYPDNAADPLPLSTELQNYVEPRDTFICPKDSDPVTISDYASYDPFYVARSSSSQTEATDQLTVGCPRHRENNSSTSLFSTGSTQITNISPVQANGLVIPPDGSPVQRSISNLNDELTFDDGSIVKITSVVDAYKVSLTQSVKLSDGTLYSIIRVQGDGTINNTVVSGSKFEVVTPSAIVGVRGTEFDVITSDGGETTNVNIISGRVIVTEKTTGETVTLTPTGTTSSVIPKNYHSHGHWHADGSYHEHEHPSKQNAHHGKKKGKIYLKDMDSKD